MKSFVVYLLFVKIVLCCGQFEKNICVGDVEIAFSVSANNFNKARLSCQSFGGDLVKIGSAAIQMAIQNTIVVKPEYYIGAYDSNGDNGYRWLVDDTEVPKNPGLSLPGPSSGYQYWKSNQPNLLSEKCVSTGQHGLYVWADESCYRIYRYICQRSSEHMLTVTRSNDIVTCVSSAIDVALRWEKKSVIVESSIQVEFIKRVDQTVQLCILKTRTSLNQEVTLAAVQRHHALLGKTTQGTIAVTVDGTPTIIEIENNKCNSSLRITWKPNHAAVGFNHTIVALNFSNVPVFESPKRSGIYVTEISGLSVSTQYTIKVTACTKAESCNTGFTAKSSGATNGISDPVTKPRLEAAEGGNCVVTWDKYNKASSFKITTQCALHPTRSAEHVLTSNRIVTTYSMIFQPLPNRRCEAFIQAKGCGAISKSVKADGVCLTSAKEPDFVKRPALFSNRNGNSHVIEIEKPSESNGLISCLFVIICYEKCDDKFTFDKLKKANGTDAKAEVGFYIAAAISMSRFFNDQYLFKPAWGNATFCDVHNNGISNSSSMSSEIFRGQNAVVMNSANTSMFLVSATPSRGNIFLKSINLSPISKL